MRMFACLSIIVEESLRSLLCPFPSWCSSASTVLAAWLVATFCQAASLYRLRICRISSTWTAVTRCCHSCQRHSSTFASALAWFQWECKRTTSIWNDWLDWTHFSEPRCVPSWAQAHDWQCHWCSDGWPPTLWRLQAESPILQCLLIALHCLHV